MHIIGLDLEGVLIPEIWIEFSRCTGISELSITTRDEPDYDKLMRFRIETLQRHALGLPDILKVIESMTPLPGATGFIDWLSERYQVVILSDTFYQFALPFMRKLAWPTLFCHDLEVNVDGRVVNYRLRMPDHKRAAIMAFKSLRFGTIAVGDSYNDTTMLKAADVGIFYRPPANVIAEFPGFPVTQNYHQLSAAIDEAVRINSAG